MTLKEKYRQLLAEMKSVADSAIAENRGFSEDEKIKLKNMGDEAKKLKDDLQILQNVSELDAAMGENAVAPGQSRKSIGSAFVSNEQFTSWFKSIAPSGRIPDGVKGIQSPPINIGLNVKTLVTGSSATSGGAFIVNEDSGIYEPLGRYPTSALDLIAKRTTTSDTVEFVRQLTQVTQAAPVAESNVTTYAGSQGQVEGKKPEGAMTFERVTTPVKTIAVWVPATKRAISDAAQLRGIIDQELKDDLADELVNQVLNGNGSGENMTGIYYTPNVLGQAFVTDVLKTCRKAITNLRTNGKVNPNAWLMHPNDWETIDLLQDDYGRYHRGGPFAAGPQTLWGVPVVESFHAVEGTPLLGNWNKAVLWDREESTISISDSHADFFICNMVAILGEMRAAFGVIRPTAFCEVSLSAS